MITKKLLSYAAILAFAMSLGFITPAYAHGESHDQNSVKRQVQEGKMNLAHRHHHHHHHHHHRHHRHHHHGHHHHHHGHKHHHHHHH